MNACAMQPLVEARRDRRIDDAESASVERHLLACASCRAYADDLEVIGQAIQRNELPRSSPLEHRRKRLALLRAAALPPARHARHRTGWALAALVLSVGVVALLALPRDAARLTIALPQPSIAPQSTIAASVQKAPEARFDRQRRTSASGEMLEWVRLYDGTIDVHVEPLRAGQRFIVATRDAEVEVRGTRFSVHAEHDALQRVVVRQGRVDVRLGESVETLETGETWSARREAPEPPRADAMPAPAPVATSAPRTPEPSDASKAFASAVAQLETHDYRRASEALRDFARDHPTDPRAEDADFLAIVALQRGGQHATAALAARRYLARYPHSARRGEVERIAGQTP